MTLPDLRQFGPLLADLRTRHQPKLSQRELALLAGYDASYVRRLEDGRRQPSRDTVAALCAVLDLDTLDWARLHVAAGYLPPGAWVVMADDWLALAKED